MKKTALIILLAVVWVNVHAQVTLEHSYSFSGSLTEIDEGEFKFFVMDVPLAQCRIYNEDHSLFKSIDLDIPSGYYLYDIKFISRRLFNTDDDIELLYVYYRVDEINAQSVYTYGMKVVNESGSVLMSLSNGGYAELVSGSQGVRLLAYQYVFYDYYYLVYTNVYDLGGSAGKALTNTRKNILVYPNPSNDLLKVIVDPALLHVSGRLKMTDMAGRTVTSQSISQGENTIDLGNHRISPGIYQVSVVTDSGERFTEKVIKY